MIALGVAAIAIIAAIPIFRFTQRHLSSPATQLAMKALGQEALNHMADELGQSRRLFSETTNDLGFALRADFSSGAAPMAGSRLPNPDESKAKANATPSFATARVGNRLFFVRRAEPVTLVDGQTINTYVFQAYYLALDDTKRIGGVSRRELWEWRSRPYAAQGELAALPDNRARADAIARLAAAGISAAWNASATDVKKAFFLLKGSALTADPDHKIAEGAARRLTGITEGMAKGGYRLGVSPNTDGNLAGYPVPKYAAAAGDFPSGFEVVIVGPKSARQIFMRLVLTAQGRFSGSISSEQVTLVTVRDLW
jgi:hypothetical protein